MSSYDGWLEAQWAARFVVNEEEVIYEVENVNNTNSYDLTANYTINRHGDLLITVEDKSGTLVTEFERVDEMMLWFYELDDADPDEAEALIVESRAELAPIPQD